MMGHNCLWTLQVFCKRAKKNPDGVMVERQRVMARELEDAEAASYKRIVEHKLADRSKTKYSKVLFVKASAFFHGNDHNSISDRNIKQAG